MPKLSAKFVEGKPEPGRYSDGDGLIFIVGKNGNKRWVVRVQSNGKRQDFGLGSFSKVGLAEAREKARATRSLVAQGGDPTAMRKRAQGIPTFREAAKSVYDLNKGEWRNAKHKAQWWTTLETYAFPKMGGLAVDKIDTDHVLEVLQPLWTAKPETARRLRQRIVAVLDWAHGHRFRDQPLHISAVNAALPKFKRKVEHHPAVEYSDAPKFAARLTERETMARLALTAVLLTACRSGEVREAVWSEIDEGNALWRIPGARMKAGSPHVVPLSKQALAVFKRAKELHTIGDRFIFPGAKRGKPLSNMALLKVMRDMDMEEVPHGLRSTFRDWISETTDYSGDLAEAALAHTIKNKVEASYRRGKLLDKRRVMMQDWADYCLPD